MMVFKEIETFSNHLSGHGKSHLVVESPAAGQLMLHRGILGPLDV